MHKFYSRIETVLTITTHSSSHTLFKSAILTSIAIDPLNCALLVFGAWPVIDLLLDGPPKESLELKDVH